MRGTFRDVAANGILNLEFVLRLQHEVCSGKLFSDRGQTILGLGDIRQIFFTIRQAISPAEEDFTILGNQYSTREFFFCGQALRVSSIFEAESFSSGVGDGGGLAIVVGDGVAETGNPPQPAIIRLSRARIRRRITVHELRNIAASFMDLQV